MSKASCEFTHMHAQVLSPFLDAYKVSKNEKQRAKVVNDARDAIMHNSAVQEDRAIGLPKGLKGAISRYFKGSVEKEKSEEAHIPKPTKTKSIYTIRDVIKKLHPDLIIAEIPFKSTDKEYIGSYQRAVTTVMANLSEEELEEAEKLTEVWNSEGAPADVQLKMAKKKLPKEIKKKLEEWKLASGAVIMCLVAYPDGDQVESFHIESAPVVGNCFTNSCSDWREGTYSNFKEWAVKQFGLKDQDSDDEDEDVPVHFKKAKDLIFDVNKDGEFILPDFRDFKTIRQKQRVVRGYIGAVYREFTGNSTALFPYSLASKDEQFIYSPDCVPEGFTLSDPDHLNGHKITRLYMHWLGRQQKGLVPFIVLKGSPHHGESGKKARQADRKGKKKKDWVEVEDDEMVVDGEEEEEDLVPNDVDEDWTLDLKIGPPTGKKQTFTGDPSQIAGPSTLCPPPASILPTTSTPALSAPVSHTPPAPEPLPKTKRSKNTKSGPTQKKVDRKRTDNTHMAEELPMKSKKRKAEEQVTDESSMPLKKMKLPSTLPSEKPIFTVSPPQPPLRSRDAARIKDFPAGNAATSSSRIAFLKTLCNVPKYLDMLQLVQIVPKPSPIPSNYPAWASWRSKDTYLPPEFHTSHALAETMAILKKDLADPSILPGKIDAPLLLLGLMYQEVARAMEIEPDAPTKAPDHLVNSSFGVKELKKIDTLLKGVKIPSE